MSYLKLLVLCFASLLYAGAQDPCGTITGTYNDWIGSATRKEVVIVGGGIAGLNAAKTLLSNQVEDVIVLEAQDYLGGRVKTHRQGSILVEDGAEWIHGGVANPLYNLASKLGGLTQPLANSAFDWRAKTSAGKNADLRGYDAVSAVFVDCENDAILANYQNTGYGQCYIDRFPQKYTSLGAPATEKNAWLYYLQMWVNKDTGTNNWLDQSGRDADRFTDWGLDEWNQWKNGYDTLTKNILESVPSAKIKTSTPVCKVFWSSDPDGRVLVVTANKEVYLADYVIVTASVGHLKERHSQLFSPQLPTDYQTALGRIELGVADKVQIGWASPWWGTKPLDINIIFTSFNLTAEESWLYNMMEVMSIHQQKNLIQGFVVGDGARRMEQLPEETVKQHLLKHLKRVTGRTTNVPAPSFFRRTRWGNNTWTRGSYNSYITVAGDTAGLKSREPLAKAITNSKGKNVIFWAGEHTHDTRYGTVDGAMESGEREAFKIIDARLV